MTNQVNEIEQQPDNLASALQIIAEQKAEIKKLKESETALADANIRVAELFMDLEDAQDQVLDQQNEIQRQNEELTSNVEHLKMVNQQLSELTEVNATLENDKTQAEIVRKAHQSVLSSINYARRIQDSLLPEIHDITSWYKQFFVYYLPKDIVGGDFYWCAENSQARVLVAADCTGHGVPGAFMTLIGHNLLNKIVQDKNVCDPAQILTDLDRELCKTLKQDEKSDCRDSIELTVMVDYTKHDFIEIASARRPFVCFKQGQEPEVFKGDRSPVGDAYFKAKQFQSFTFRKEKGTRFYFFSDGFVDQFGGTNNKKYGKKRLIEFLQSVQEKPVVTQRLLLEKEFHGWKGSHAQIDDVLVMGVQF